MVKSEKTEQNTEEKPEKQPRFEEPSHCLLCGVVGPALLYGHWVCEHCKNVVQAEALSKSAKSKRKAADKRHSACCRGKAEILNSEQMEVIHGGRRRDVVCSPLDSHT